MESGRETGGNPKTGNAGPADVTIRSVAELLQSVPQHGGQQSFWLFRGQADSGWELKPKLLRPEYVSGSKDYLDLQIRNFKQYCRPHLDHSPQDEWEWLSLAQHHGLVTNLLDWSTSPLVALYFAVESHPTSEGCVWGFNPLSDERRRGDAKYDRTRFWVFEPSRISPRIVAQLAWLTAHPYLAPREIDPTRLRRILIPANIKPVLQLELDALGVNRAALFPDLDGIAKHLNWVLQLFLMSDRLKRERAASAAKAGQPREGGVPESHPPAKPTTLP